MLKLHIQGPYFKTYKIFLRRGCGGGVICSKYVYEILKEPIKNFKRKTKNK